MTRSLPDICDGVVVPEVELEERVIELGEAITRDFQGCDLRLVTVLRGGVMFLADLARAIDLPVRLDFMAVSPYAPGAGGAVRITKDLDDSIAGADVILVEDVIDTGLTINYVLSVLKARDPRTLSVCTLLDKDVRRIADVPVAYRGFWIPDKFVIGYGLDLKGRYRNLPLIASVPDEVVFG